MKPETHAYKPAARHAAKSNYKKWLKNRHVKEILGINDAALKQYISLGLIETHQPYKGANRLYNPEDVERFIRKK